MGRIDEKVVAALNDDLMEYIFEDTRDLIHTFESKILKKEYEVFSKFDKLIERIQNVIELSFRYVDNSENTIPCDVAWLLVDLAELKCADNIKGIKGIGPKTAAKYINQFRKYYVVILR